MRRLIVIAVSVLTALASVASTAHAGLNLGNHNESFLS